MKTVTTKEIKYDNMVAAFNADAFAVENDEDFVSVIEAMGEQTTAYNEDDEEFAELAALLDGTADTYSVIYHSNGATLGVLAMWVTRDSATGTMIEPFSSKEEAEEAVQKYEASDKAEGIYEPDFYEVAKI